MASSLVILGIVLFGTAWGLTTAHVPIPLVMIACLVVAAFGIRRAVSGMGKDDSNSNFSVQDGLRKRRARKSAIRIA